VNSTATEITMPAWRWAVYLIVVAAALLSSLWTAEAMMAGMFMGWSGKSITHIFFCLILLATESAVLFFAFRAIAASRRGDLAGALLAVFACLTAVPIAIGILASGLFEP